MRDRALITTGLIALVALAWWYLVREAAGMDAMSREMQMHAAMGMTGMRTWGAAEWLGLLAMWAVMMAAMMLPSAAPVILLVLGAYRRRGDRQARLAAVAFTSGYLATWTAFSLAASTVQFFLHRAALVADDMRLASGWLAGGVLVLAGVYQWLPVKNVCLTHCQSPLGFLSQHWREGIAGGWSMGVRHGAFCVGCCWLLMTLLFAVGVMNLVWVAGLAAFVLVEKLTRAGPALGRAAGVVLAAWGVYVMAG